MWMTLSLGMVLTTSVEAASGSSSSDVDLRGFHWVVEAGSYTGLAAGGIYMPDESFGIEITGGYNPLLIGIEGIGGELSELELLNSYQGNADLLLTPYQTGVGARIGLTAGYKYNSLLEHGLGAGVAVSAELTKRVGFHVLGGVAFFPDGDDQVRGRLSEDSKVVASEFIRNGRFHIGASVGLLFH